MCLSANSLNDEMFDQKFVICGLPAERCTSLRKWSVAIEVKKCFGVSSTHCHIHGVLGKLTRHFIDSFDFPVISSEKGAQRHCKCL